MRRTVDAHESELLDLGLVTVATIEKIGGSDVLPPAVRAGYKRARANLEFCDACRRGHGGTLGAFWLPVMLGAIIIGSVGYLAWHVVPPITAGLSESAEKLREWGPTIVQVLAWGLILTSLLRFAAPAIRELRAPQVDAG